MRDRYPTITFRISPEMRQRLLDEAQRHDEKLSATIKRLLEHAMTDRATT